MKPDRVARVALEAPAKINLSLRVVGTRPDGYHLIESLFLPLDLADELEIEVAWPGTENPSGEPGEVQIGVEPAPPDERPDVGVGGVDTRGIPADDRNLAVAAARAYLRALAEQPSLNASDLPAVSLTLRKRIPAAAGLGGGSSDAGAVLSGLSRLIPEGPSGRSLEALALALGADVPYFLRPQPAVVTGIGETIAPVAELPALSLLLVNPGVSVATAEVYRLYDVLQGAADPPGAALTTPDPGSTMPALSGPGAAEDALSRLLDLEHSNDLEPAAVRLCPVIARVRKRLRDLGAESVGMSGSGATVYGVFASDAAAGEALKAACFEPPVWARVVRSLSSSGCAAADRDRGAREPAF